MRNRPFWNKVPGFIRNDFIRKVLALILTMALYYYAIVTIHDTRQIRISLPLPVPEGFVLQDKTVELTLNISGPNNRKNNLDFERAISFRDLAFDTKLFNGVNCPLTIYPHNIKTPWQYSVKSVAPQYLNVRMDRIETKKVLVDPNFRGSLPNGCRIDRIEIVPKHLLISGPHSVLTGISRLKTEPIPLDGITQTFEFSSKLSLPEKEISLSQNKVRVNIFITKNMAEYTFKGIPIRLLGNLQGHFRVELLDHASADVTVAGPSSKVAAMSSRNITVFVDTAAINTPGIHTAEVNCWLEKPDIQVKLLTPQNIKVKVIK